ncbi:MAG: OmpH family outer membrane protein [Phycisphaerae bacterium]|nr:OmpH family outer membrane protein [Phycisphaerae bacterium]
MKTKHIVLAVLACIVVLAVVGARSSKPKSEPKSAEEATADMKKALLKVEKLTEEVEDLQNELDTVKQGGSKGSSVDTEEVMKKQARKQQSGDGLNIAFVSIRKIFQECRRSAAYREGAIAEQDKAIAELQTLSKEIEAEKAGLNTLRQDSSDYMVRAKALFEKQASYQAQQEFYKQQMDLKDQLWTKELYQDILRIVSAIAKEKGLDLVFREDEIDFTETNSNEIGLAMRMQKVLYSGGCLDITNEITARLDAGK